MRPPPELVEAIFDAAIDDALWPEVVARMTAWVGGAVGGLQVRELTPRLRMQMFTSGLDPAFGRSYEEVYFRLDPHLSRVSALRQGESVLSSDILDDEAYERTAYYQEWVRPQGLHDLQGSTILRDRKRIVSFATFGAVGTRFDASTLARMQALVPSLARAFRVRTALQEVAELRALASTKPSPDQGAALRNPSGLASQLPDDEQLAALPPSLQPVAQALVAGLSDKEIADTLSMSLSTTRTYVTRTLRKLGVKSRRELLLRVPA